MILVLTRLMHYYTKTKYMTAPMSSWRRHLLVRRFQEDEDESLLMILGYSGNQASTPIYSWILGGVSARASGTPRALMAHNCVLSTFQRVDSPLRSRARRRWQTT